MKKQEKIIKLIKNDETLETVYTDNSKRGITLIALIVTIIILLILAGVTLNIILDSDGILSKAQNAVEVTNESAIKEDIQLAILEQMTEYYEKYANLSATYPTVMDYVKAQFTEEKPTPSGAKLKYDEESGKFEYTKDGQMIEVNIDEKGNVSLGNTEKVPEKPVAKYTITYDANGGENAPVDSKEYKENDTVNIDFTNVPTRENYIFLGWAKTSDALEAEFTQDGTNTFVMQAENVTLYAVWDNRAVSIIKGKNYGDKVNYEANDITNWKIFMNDGSNVYLISEDVIDGNKVPVEGTIKTIGNLVVTSDEKSETLVNWMLNTEKWSSFVNKTYAQYATGGPTIDQLIKSVNGKLKTNYTNASSIMNKTLSDDLFKLNVYWWVATTYSVNQVYRVQRDGILEYNFVNHTNGTCGIRPLICLLDSTKMTWNGTEWDLSL